jgi:hypothetical protein
MKSLLKIAQRGLETTAELHPSADLLTAFSERSLPNWERNNVIGHLAECAECREIVSLAAPVLPPSLPAEMNVKIRPALAWRPVLAWSGVAACVLIVAGSFLMKPGLMKRSDRNKGSGIVAKKEAPASFLQQRAASAQSAPAIRTERNAVDRASFGDLRAKAGQKASQNSTASSNSIVSSKALSEQALSKSRDAFNADASASKPESSPDGRGAAKPVNQPSASPASPASPVEMKESFAASTSANSSRGGTIKIDDRSPHWTLDSDGTLLRSFGIGTSWQKIVIPGNSALLHAIATVGPDVWVGGASGVIYHSADAGSHWSQVKASSGGKPLADDIISIEFTTAQQGRLTTSRQESWTTSDGGASWNTR